jgi:hypothetical protein
MLLDPTTQITGCTAMTDLSDPNKEENSVAVSSRQLHTGLSS